MEIYDIYNKVYNNIYIFITILVLLFSLIYLTLFKYNLFYLASAFPQLAIILTQFLLFIYLISYYYFKKNKNDPDKNIFNFPKDEIKNFSNYFSYLFKVSGVLLFPLFCILLFLYILFQIIYYYEILMFNIYFYSIIGFIILLYKNKELLNVKTIFKFLSDIKYIILFTLIFLVSFLPKYILKFITTYDGHVLIDKPVYLNNKYTKGDQNILYKITPRNYNYSISLWFWLTPQPSNTNYAYQKYTNILTFDKKPAVEYNGKTNTLRVIFDNTYKEHTIFSSKNVLYQKWNNLVINYTDGNVDTFLNSDLIGSKPNISPFYNYTFVDIGENKGLHGGVSNVVFYNSPLTMQKIKFNYNYFKNLNEPYN